MSWMGMAGMADGKDGALMPGMATNTEMKKLGTLNGKQAEIFYLQLMTDHHQGGIHMAQVASTSAPSAWRSGSRRAWSTRSGRRSS